MSLNSNQVTCKHEQDEFDHKNLKKNGLVKLDVNLWTESFCLNEVARAVAVLAFLPDVPCSNIGWQTHYPARGFSWYYLTFPAKYPNNTVNTSRPLRSSCFAVRFKSTVGSYMDHAALTQSGRQVSTSCRGIVTTYFCCARGQNHVAFT